MKNGLKLETRFLNGFVSGEDIEKILPEVERAHSFLMKKNGPGGDFLGWMDIPENTSGRLLKEIEEDAENMTKMSDVVIVIGIGGSYLGARAAIEMLTPYLGKKNVIFAGNNICGGYLSEIEGLIEKEDVSVNVISKSGTTTEPAIAFRVIEHCMKKKYGPRELKKRIICTTDRKKGALRELADKEGYKTYVIPDDVGGRFSVLTPVGLLPIACAGIDIKNMIEGAAKAREESLKCEIERNMSYKYAAIRNVLYRKGKMIEILSGFDPALHYVSEWWKQLFGESEGKGNKGIFPASVDLTTDLHSMGQWIQDGTRNIFETFLYVEKGTPDCRVPAKKDDLEGLNYLSGEQVSFVNEQAYRATAEAHFEGGVPNITVSIPEKSAFALGGLFYFFEKAAAVSAYILGVNPFDQPGVESYKKKMFKLLGKPE